MLRHKAVRDLHWVMASAHMLAPNGFVGVPVLSDAFCQGLVADSVPWLRALDEQPAQLVTWLSQQRNIRRLGFYFAALLEYWVHFCPALSVLSSEVLVTLQLELKTAPAHCCPAFR